MMFLPYGRYIRGEITFVVFTSVYGFVSGFVIIDRRIKVFCRPWFYKISPGVGKE